MDGPSGTSVIGSVNGAMSWATGLYHIIAAVLVSSGIAKIVRPASAAATLSLVRLPRWTARPLGVVEVGLGSGALAGLPLAPVVAAAYVIFGVTAELGRRQGVADCGCFGTTKAPPTLTHVGVNLLAALVATLAATGRVGSVAGVVAEQPAAGVPYLLAVTVGTSLVVALYTVGAEVAALTRSARLR